MIESMTGFGKANFDLNNKKISIEIRSLNSKHLDLNLRLPSIYRELELELRKKISSKLKRGKVDCFITIDNNISKKKVNINKKIANEYYLQLRELAELTNQSKNDLLPMVMKMPEVYSIPMDDLQEKEKNIVFDLVDECLIKVKEFRSKEGLELFEEYSNQIDTIKLLLNKVLLFEKERIRVVRDRIYKNIEELNLNDKFDKNRFEQELIYYIEKFDISEEKMRLSNHLDFFEETMKSPNSNGKKLGFITQEISREINTLGSKSYHTEMQKIIVQMKDELEKIKEQILNTL